MKVGNTIKRIRNKRGFSQQKLAEISKTSLLTVSKIERGVSRPSADVLDKICESLGVPKSVVILMSTDISDIEESKKEAFSILSENINQLIELTYDL